MKGAPRAAWLAEAGRGRATRAGAHGAAPCRQRQRRRRARVGRRRRPPGHASTATGAGPAGALGPDRILGGTVNSAERRPAGRGVGLPRLRGRRPPALHADQGEPGARPRARGVRALVADLGGHPRLGDRGGRAPADLAGAARGRRGGGRGLVRPSTATAGSRRTCARSSTRGPARGAGPDPRAHS